LDESMADLAGIPANLRPGAFAGAAEAYARYRPPYPPHVLADLLDRAAVGREALLDLATGPGRIALDLAPRFARVVAVDLEPDMIDVARREAARRDIKTVTWHVGRVETFEAQTESFDLVTIGEAFHRLEAAVVARNVFRWLRPGGCLATLGTDNRFSGDEPWEVTYRVVRDRWIARSFPEGFGLVLPGGALDQADREAAMRSAGFVDIQGHDFEQTVQLSFDELVGYLASTSGCSRKAIGPDFDVWIDELRSTLGADNSTRFTEHVRWGYTLARKPG
jgi:SAM-dependent methyltransferase